MNTEAVWQRGLLLFQQQRWELAIDELRRLLTQDPEHASAHALLGLALLQSGDLDGALGEARVAVGTDPESDFAYRALAAVHLERDDLDQAVAAIERAIELDPGDVMHRSVLAQIRLGQKRWDDALAAADAGLALDPQDTDCLNLRSSALTRLGRGAEASDSLDASLAEDPDNPYTHQARGFALLHRGDARGAVKHFQEALRRDPTLDGARAGLVEALKAQNPIYRSVLGWFLWLDRFDRTRQLQILIGIWLAARFGGASLRSGGYETAATIVGYSWLLFVLATACAVPLFNLLLLLHPLGRHALDRTSRTDAIVLGITFFVAVTVSALAFFSPALWSYFGWLFWWLLLLPVAGTGVFGQIWGRRLLQILAGVLAIAWVVWAVSIEMIEVVDYVPPPADNATFSSNVAIRVPNPDVVRAHLNWMSGLQITAALSTWFVLFAPKGRRRRGR